MLSQAGQQLVDRLPVPLGDGPEGVGAVVKAVLAGVVLIEAVAGGGIELDAEGLDEVVDRVLDRLFGTARPGVERASNSPSAGTSGGRRSGCRGPSHERG